MSKKNTKKGISPFDFFSIGFGAIVGVGWAVSINNWVANAGGPLPASLGYVMSLILMIPIALAYAELTPMLPVAGGGVAFAYKAFGEKVAYISGWAAIGAFITIIPWEAIYVTKILSILFPVLTSGGPVYNLVDTDIYWQGIVLGTLLSAILFYLNWIGAKTSATFQRVMCTALIGAGLIAIIFALFKADVANLRPLYENVGKGTHTTFWTGALIIFASSPFFLAGFETIPQAIEDSDGDVKNVGKTVVASVGLACIFYAVMLISIGLAIPWKQFYGLEQPAVSNLFKIVYDGPLGTVLFVIILLGALAGLLTTWNGFMMATPRLMMSLARASLIPHIFAKQNKYGTPIAALIFCGLFSVSGPFLGMGLIDPLTSFASAGFMLSWLITLGSLIILRKKEPNLHRPYKVPTMLIPWFGIILTGVIFILFLIPGSPCYITDIALKLFAGWMAIGLVLYFINSPARKSIPVEQRTATLFAHMKENK